MTVAQWRLRAEACRAKARLESDRDAKRLWQSLSEGWLALSETWPGPAVQRERDESSDDDRPAMIASGERLRARLTLVR